MNNSSVFDWKIVIAFGVAISSIILVSKMDANDATQVSIRMIDALKGSLIAKKSSY